MYKLRYASLNERLALALTRCESLHSNLRYIQKKWIWKNIQLQTYPRQIFDYNCIQLHFQKNLLVSKDII